MDRTADILSALGDLRDATERAITALERHDAEGVTVALEEGERAAERLALLEPPRGRTPAPLRREVERISALQAVALDRAERARSETGLALDALAAGERGLRGYRPADELEPSLLDRES